MTTVLERIEASPKFHKEMGKLVERSLTADSDELAKLTLAFLAQGDIDFYQSFGFDSGHTPGVCLTCDTTFVRKVNCELHCPRCYNAYMNAAKRKLVRASINSH